MLLQSGNVFLPIPSIIDNLPHRIYNKYGQKYKNCELPIQIGKYCDKRHPYYKHCRRDYAFEYFVRQRLYRKAKPPSKKVVFLHN